MGHRESNMGGLLRHLLDSIYERINLRPNLMLILKRELDIRSVSPHVRDEILEAARSLPVKVIRCLILRIQGYTHEKIAKKIGCSRQRVTQYLSRNLLEVKNILEKCP